jgi:hypothetical protein
VKRNISRRDAESAEKWANLAGDGVRKFARAAKSVSHRDTEYTEKDYRIAMEDFSGGWAASRETGNDLPPRHISRQGTREAESRA